MSPTRSRVIAAAIAWLLAACAHGGSGAEPGQPAPAKDKDKDKSPYGPSTTPHGSAVIYRPIRAAGFTIERHDTLDLQLPGGASQVQLLDRTGFLHVSLAPTADSGFAATIILDSLRVTAGGVPAGIDSVARAQGTRWTATLSATGDLSELKSDRSSSLGDQFASSLRALFPRLPPGGVRAGMEWSDSSSFPVRADAFNATEQAMTTYRSTDGSASGGRKAIRVESEGSYTRSGKGTQFDQEMEMTASGKRHAVHLIGADGLLVSAQGGDSGDMTITVPAQGQTVPVKQSGTFSITSSASPAR
jgi:hypothetical protein